MEDPRKNGVLDAWPCTNRECLIGDGKVRGSHGYTEKTRPQESLTKETRVKECWKEDFPLVKENWITEHVAKPDINKPMGPIRLSSVVLSNRTKRQWAEIHAQQVPLEHEEELYCASDQALEQRGCGISFTGNIQEPFGCAMCPTMTLLKQGD